MRCRIATSDRIYPTLGQPILRHDRGAVVVMMPRKSIFLDLDGVINKLVFSRPDRGPRCRLYRESRSGMGNSAHRQCQIGHARKEAFQQLYDI